MEAANQDKTMNSQGDSLYGRTVDSSDPAALRQAIEDAFHYRGDVTITLKSTGRPVEGYVFDRRSLQPSGEIELRLIPRQSDAWIALSLSDIVSIAFTGRDTASGKSFESWVRKYAEKKFAGEDASLESEPLDAE